MPTFDARLGRYRGDDGRLVSERAVRDAVDNLADLSSQRMAAFAQRLQSGALPLADWQVGMSQEIKSAHVAAGVAAHGGRVQMAPSDWGFLGQRIRTEYGFLRDFAGQIADGTQPLDGRLIARARMYGQGARMSYEAVRARDDRNRGMTEERDILAGSDHCTLCPDLAAQGWVPIGTLPAIGTRPCGVNDRCRIERRTAPARADAA